MSSSTSSFNINVANRPAYFIAPYLTTVVTNVLTPVTFTFPSFADLDGDPVTLQLVYLLPSYIGLVKDSNNVPQKLEIRPDSATPKGPF